MPIPGTDSIIDLSHWNEIPNIHQVKASGVQAIIHKASQGLGTDPEYAIRRTLAKSVGLLWGAYHFGVQGHSAIDQADYFVQLTGTLDGPTRRALDWEWNGADTMQIDQAVAFVQRIQEKTGRWPMLYTSAAFLETTDMSRWDPTLLNCDLWLTGFTKVPLVPPQWAAAGVQFRIWQHGIGQCPGIVGQVDRDTFNGTPEELTAYFS